MTLPLKRRNWRIEILLPDLETIADERIDDVNEYTAKKYAEELAAKMLSPALKTIGWRYPREAEGEMIFLCYFARVNGDLTDPGLVDVVLTYRTDGMPWAY